MLLDDLLITRSTTGRRRILVAECQFLHALLYFKESARQIHTLNYVQRMLYCDRHSHKIKKANQQFRTKQNKTRVNYPDMKFSTSTITTAFALVAVSGLCTIPTSVEVR